MKISNILILVLVLLDTLTRGLNRISSKLSELWVLILYGHWFVIHWVPIISWRYTIVWGWWVIQFTNNNVNYFYNWLCVYCWMIARVRHIIWLLFIAMLRFTFSLFSLEFWKEDKVCGSLPHCNIQIGFIPNILGNFWTFQMSPNIWKWLQPVELFVSKGLINIIKTKTPPISISYKIYKIY